MHTASRTTLIVVATSLLTLSATMPAFAQGATMSPPSPNASNSAPTPPNSIPPGAETGVWGRTGNARAGSNIMIGRVGNAITPVPTNAPVPVNPNAPGAETVPVPQSQ